jgi:hypothetical protein
MTEAVPHPGPVGSGSKGPGGSSSTQQGSAFLFIETTPDPVDGAGLQRPVQTRHSNLTPLADLAGILDLLHCRTDVADREEQLRILGQAGRPLPPVLVGRSWAPHDCRTEGVVLRC